MVRRRDSDMRSTRAAGLWLVVLVLVAASSCAIDRAERAPIVIGIAAFNDFHGNLQPPGSPTRVSGEAGRAAQSLPTGGIAYLASLVAEIRGQYEHHVVVAAGDLIGGSPLISALFRDEPTIELLSEAGLEYSAVGNHEFDAGRDELLRKQRGGCAQSIDRRQSCADGVFPGARFQYLAANVVDERTGASLFPGYAIKQFSIGASRTVSIGFIGLVLKDTPNLVMPNGVAGLRFTDEVQAANALVPQLRARGVEAIVVLIHEGGRTSASSFDDESCPNLNGPIVAIAAQLDPAIDLIVSGHTHNTYICRRGARLITSAGAEGRFVTDIKLSIDPTSLDVVSADAHQRAVVNDSLPNPLPARYPTLAPDKHLEAMIERVERRVTSIAERPIARIAANITRDPTASGESALGNLVADAQLEATRAAGAQIALMNRGGLRTDLRARGEYVTYQDLFAVHPFGNGLITMDLTGTQLRTLLEQQWSRPNAVLSVSNGFSYEWDAAAPIGSRVIAGSMRLEGERIELTRVYRITVNEFLAAGGDGFSLLTSGAHRVRGPLDVDALDRYVTARSTLTPPPTDRVKRRH